MRISVIGCGYLGAVHAAAMAELGHEVVGIDVDADDGVAEVGHGCGVHGSEVADADDGDAHQVKSGSGSLSYTVGEETGQRRRPLFRTPWLSSR